MQESEYMIGNSFANKDSQTIQQQNLQIYKKNLLYKVILVLVILSMFVLERIFYVYIEQFENNILTNFQYFLGIREDIQAKNLKYKLLKNLSGVTNQKYYLIFQTHFYVTLYVGMDGILSLKIMTMNFMGIYMLNLLSMFYSGPRPYWLNTDISSFNCYTSYSHPDIFSFSIVFFLFYSYQCYMKSQKQITLIQLDYIQSKEKSKRIVTIIFTLSLFIYLILLFVIYIQGDVFIINIILSLCIFVVYYLFVFQMDSSVNNLIKKFTIMKLEAKRSIFNWTLFVIIGQLVSRIVYVNNQNMDVISFIKEYIDCAKENNIGFQYDEYKNQKYLIGPYETYCYNFILIPLLGAVLGAAKTFNKLVTVHWYRGSLKHRFFRILISNLCIFPLWIIYTLEKKYLIENHYLNWLGLNSFALNCIIYFFSYYFLFGILPSYIFPKLRLTSIDLNQIKKFNIQK